VRIVRTSDVGGELFRPELFSAAVGTAYGLAEWAQAGSSAVYSFLYPV
jgi:hypothetical protein